MFKLELAVRFLFRKLLDLVLTSCRRSCKTVAGLDQHHVQYYLAQGHPLTICVRFSPLHCFPVLIGYDRPTTFFHSKLPCLPNMRFCWLKLLSDLACQKLKCIESLE